jgi:hypothetical protein
MHGAVWRLCNACNQPWGGKALMPLLSLPACTTYPTQLQKLHLCLRAGPLGEELNESNTSVSQPRAIGCTIRLAGWHLSCAGHKR